jgi:parvulin-like peptidyl-prolyl isomerase
VLVLGACGEESTVRPPAARVNGVRITDADIVANQNLFLFLAELQGRPCGSAEGGEGAGPACNREILTNLIQEEIIKAYAEANDVPPVTQQEVDDAIAPIVQGGDPRGGGTNYDDQLKALDITTEDLESLARRLLLFGHVREYFGTLEIPEEDLRAAYEEHILEYVTFHAKHILVTSAQEARLVAAEATPENFEDLARERSIDPSAKDNGGDLGSLPATQLVEPFSRAAIALEPGEISEPVQTEFGWHVIYLVEKDVRPFEEVRSSLQNQAGATAFDDWLREQYTSGDIEVNPRYGRIDPGTGQVVPIRSTQPGEGGSTEETTPPAT